MGSSDRLQVNVQLQQDADVAESTRKLARVPGVLRVTQTFPGDSDEQLARMFVVEVATARAEATLSALRRLPGLRVDTPVRRKLIQ